MHIEALRTLVSEFGISVTIAIIFVFLAYKFIKNTLNQNQLLIKKVLEKEANDRQHHNDLIDLRLEINNKVKNILESFQLSNKSDRIYVFEYHNGESNLNGLPFAKVSATYELLQIGLPSYKQRLQGIPSGLILDFNQKVITEEKMAVLCTDDYNSIDPIGYNVLMRPDTASFFVYLIKNSRGYPIGFVGVDYIKESVTADRAYDIMNNLADLSSRVGALLDIDNIKFN